MLHMSVRRILHSLCGTLRRASSPLYALLLCRCPGLSQRIEDVTVDWSDYTGIFDGFEVQWQLLERLFDSLFSLYVSCFSFSGGGWERRGTR